MVNINEIGTHINQEKVIVDNQIKDGKTFGVIARDDNQKANLMLSNMAYRLWVEICLNQHGYAFALSPKLISERTGMSESSYHRAVKELKHKGFMERVKGNVYKFHMSLDDENETM